MLGRASIALAGSLAVSGTPGFFTTSDNLGITGGTGQFERARGEAHLADFTETGNTVTLRVHD